MIRNKLVKYILHIVTILVTIFLCFYNDIYTKNLSTLTLSLNTYIMYFIYALLLLITYFDIAKKYLKKKMLVLFVISIFLVLFPYSETNAIVKSLHLLCCYSAFTIFTICMYTIFFKFWLDNKNGKILLTLLTLSILFMGTIYAKYLCINGLMELVYLLSVNISMFMIDRTNMVK